MNEAQTRLSKIDPKLRAAGWGVEEESHIKVEYSITQGRVSRSVAAKGLRADYVLEYKGAKLAVVEAKSDEKEVGEGVAQAKLYAKMLAIRYTYATNGDKIYFMDLESGEEEEVGAFATPAELWRRTFGAGDEWRDKFYGQPLFSNGTREARYYQEIAINKALSAIAAGKDRILLTLATGTGKTYIAFQIAWKLFQTRWTVKKSGTRPRILFLADRNVLANQAFNGFGAFAADALVRIDPGSIRKHGGVPTNGSVFFTIYQTFMTGEEGKFTFGEYGEDFFDLVIIDECHRGGARDESTWRGILEYFKSAVQIGLTATPRREINADTYRYFGEPVYQYSLKQGIEDGFLTPFRHCKMQGTLDDYIYSPEDEVLSGDVEEGKVYTEEDFYAGNIYIKQRDEARVREMLKHIKEDEKTLVFCATQNHAAQIRDMINRERRGNPEYAVRVTANDGEQGERYLRDFQDNEKTIPTVLTTSQKLSTGVDALNVRNIVLLRPIKSMIEFKQIIGRGTRLYEGKYYFTIYDFVKAYEKFQDPEWDGEPVCPVCGENPCSCEQGEPYAEGEEGEEPEAKERERRFSLPRRERDADEEGGEKPERLEIRLSDGRTRKIRFVKSDMFWGGDGKPVSAEEFLRAMFGDMPAFYGSIEELREKWSSPKTREDLLESLGEAGYDKETLGNIRSLIDADGADLLDVLEYISYNVEPTMRAERVKRTAPFVASLTAAQQEFVRHVIRLYIAEGIEELGTSKLPELLSMKYGSVQDGLDALGGMEKAKESFYGFQRSLYL